MDLAGIEVVEDATIPPGVFELVDPVTGRVLGRFRVDDGTLTSAPPETPAARCVPAAGDAVIALRELTDAEYDEHEEYVRQQSIAWAWQNWREASCEEWHGGHPWVLTIHCGNASVACPSCQAEPYPDCADVLVGEFPVHVDVTTQVYRTLEGDDYDLWVEVAPA